jgi:hypothetical protein
MHIIFVQAQLLSNLLIREIESHQIKTGNPGLQGLMATRKDAAGQVIKLTSTVATDISLPSRMGLVFTSFGD